MKFSITSFIVLVIFASITFNFGSFTMGVMSVTAVFQMFRYSRFFNPLKSLAFSMAKLRLPVSFAGSAKSDKERIRQKEVRQIIR